VIQEFKSVPVRHIDIGDNQAKRLILKFLFGFGNRAGSGGVVSLNAEKLTKRIQNDLVIINDKDIGLEHSLAPI
jgi:hypothetical protein